MKERMLEIFGQIEDIRSGNAKRHRLDEILTIAMLAILSDCSRFTEMELFGQMGKEWLSSFLMLENEIPSHDTFGDVFAAIKSAVLQASFMQWVETVCKKISGKIVAIDGKTLCASRSVAENKKAVRKCMGSREWISFR